MDAAVPPPPPGPPGPPPEAPFDPHALELRVAAAAREQGLLADGDRVLVAVSAGADSAALAGLLAADAGLEVHLGHVDHGWRGSEEAEADRRTVEGLAGRLHAPLALAPPPETIRRTEADARRHRYAALQRLAREQGCTKVATGHHRRDQAETLLLRRARGSGPQGLAGIPRRRPLGEGGLVVVRPVLDVDPRELRAYAAARGLPWRDDPTNADLDRDRARVRARLEATRERRPHAVAHLARLAHRLADRQALRAARMATRLEGSLVAWPEARAMSVDVEALASCTDAEVELALRRMGGPLRADADGPWLTRRLVALVAALVRGDRVEGAVSLPHGLEALRRGRRLLLARTTPARLAPLRLDAPPAGRTTVATGPALVATWEHLPRAAFDLDAFVQAARSREREVGHAAAAMDADALGPSLTLRAIAATDTFRPFGSSRAVRVHEFLPRHGYPDRLRRGLRVAVRSDGSVVWVVGVRIDAGAAIGPSTQTVARLSVRTRMELLWDPTS